MSAPNPPPPVSRWHAPLAPYRKLVTSVIGLALTCASLWAGSGGDAKWVAATVALATAAGVYAVPNQQRP